MHTKNFTCILRAGLNSSPITTSEVEELSHCDAEEWKVLTDLALMHGVGGVFFDGIQNLYHTHGDLLPKEDWAREVKGRLFSVTMQLEHRNRKQIAVMNKVGTFLKEHDCQMMVMKGQACAMMYPNPLHRSIGDVDCYLFNDYEKGNELIRQTGVHVDDSWYKHSEFSIIGESFENHQYFVAIRSGRHYKQLNEKLCEILVTEDLECFPNSSVLMPPVMFNALFLTYHAFIHFISEGLRLKQVLDWVMFVKKHQSDIDWKELHRLCVEYKIDRFLVAMNAIAVDFFGVKKTESAMMCESPYVQKMMNSVLYDDSYIFNTVEGDWKQRFHIVYNMIKYRWKYRDIAQQSVIKQLWTSLLGFILKTE